MQQPADDTIFCGSNPPVQTHGIEFNLQRFLVVLKGGVVFPHGLENIAHVAVGGSHVWMVAHRDLQAPCEDLGRITVMCIKNTTFLKLARNSTWQGWLE